MTSVPWGTANLLAYVQLGVHTVETAYDAGTGTAGYYDAGAGGYDAAAAGGQMRAVALYDYDAVDTTDLTFRVNDVLWVTYTAEENW